jgi:hypothetical protein
VNVVMPGGVAPVRFDERNGILERVMLFGEAHRADPQAYQSVVDGRRSAAGN